MNWGIKITILYLSFVGLIVTMVGMSSREKVELVSANYYEQELAFQDKLTKSERSNALTEPLSWEVKTGAVQLQFPKEFSGQAIKGNVFFFRPSDAGMDKTVEFQTGATTSREIDTKGMKQGVYKMEINWEVDNQKFYNEGIITIN